MLPVPGFETPSLLRGKWAQLYDNGVYEMTVKVNVSFILLYNTVPPLLVSFLISRLLLSQPIYLA